MRILEIGDHTYFKDVYPQHTTLLWTGRRPLNALPRSDYFECTPRPFIRAMRQVQAGAYDLVVAYMPPRVSVNPLVWGRAYLHEPWRFVAPVRCGGVEWLRCVRIPAPLAVLDVGDDFVVRRHNFFLFDKTDHVFKRELPADRWHILCGSLARSPSRRIRRHRRWQDRLAKLHPLALPTPQVDTTALWTGDFPEKSADIFFSGNVEENSWLRRTGVSELKQLQARGFKVDIPDATLPATEFYRRMARAWLAWSPPGFGWQCVRTGEAAQCLSVPVITHAPIERHRPLQQGEHVICYDLEMGGLVRAVEAALADKERLRRMAQQARAHVLAHHTQRAVVDHVIASILGRSPASA